MWVCGEGEEMTDEDLGETLLSFWFSHPSFPGDFFRISDICEKGVRMHRAEDQVGTSDYIISTLRLAGNMAKVIEALQAQAVVFFEERQENERNQ